jgi:hypothetical protein
MNPFASYNWEALLEEIHERQIHGRDSGPEWDLLMEEYKRHTDPTPYP